MACLPLAGHRLSWLLHLLLTVVLTGFVKQGESFEQQFEQFALCIDHIKYSPGPVRARNCPHMNILGQQVPSTLKYDSNAETYLTFYHILEAFQPAFLLPIKSD
jgi:hypothetical protein